MIDFKIELPSFCNKEYNILDFGAKVGYDFDNQSAIQKAIDSCSSCGGGKVVVPNGFFLTGPIELRSNVNLYLEDNAYIKFTKKKKQYPLSFVEFEGTTKIRAKSPITAKNCENIAITGKGILDGSGDKWRSIKKFKLTEKEWQRCLQKSDLVIKTKETEIWCPTKSYYDGVLQGEPDYSNPDALEKASENWDMYRPVFVSLIKCNKVLIQGVTIQNSPAWNIHPLYCKNFTLSGAYVKNKISAHNGDGLDLESCENCEIANTTFEAGDDGICLKSGKNKQARSFVAPTKNVWIHDCKVYNAHGGFVVGSEMSRGVEKVYIENCSFCGTDIGIRIKSTLGRGGYVRDIHVRNLYMTDIINEAILLSMRYVFTSIETVGDKLSNNFDLEDIPAFYDFYIENVQCDNSSVGLKIEGLDGYPVHDINIKDSYIKCEKDMEISNHKKIVLKNVEFCENGKTKKYNQTL